MTYLTSINGAKIDRDLTPITAPGDTKAICVVTGATGWRLLCEVPRDHQLWDTGATGWLALASSNHEGQWSYVGVEITGRTLTKTPGGGAYSIRCKITLTDGDSFLGHLAVQGGGWLDPDGYRAALSAAQARA